MLANMNWYKLLLIYKDIRVVRLLFLGMSSGLPILLIFSTLSLWLKSAGLDRSTITLFSWAGLAYAFKFLWAPLIDRISIPYISSYLGHRRSWLFITQLIIILILITISFIDPVKNLLYLAVAISLLGLSSANQDILIDAYRIESAPPNMQNAMSASYIIGYRIGMILAGAGSLYFVSLAGGDQSNYIAKPWQTAYLLMAFFQCIGMVTVLLSPEPSVKRKLIFSSKQRLSLIVAFGIALTGFITVFTYFPNINAQFQLYKYLLELVKLTLSIFIFILLFWITVKTKIISYKLIDETFYAPFKDFIFKYGKFALTLIALITCYRIADVVMGVIANLFYVDMGYSLKEIAAYSKVWGLLATIIGGLIGGLVAFKIGVNITLLIGAILAASSNLLFAFLSSIEPNAIILISVITADNLSAGLASTAFVAFLGSLTNINFTATQFALFTSIMLFIPKLLSGYAGSIVDNFGYQSFFVITAILGIPAIIINIYLIKVTNKNVIK